MQSHTLSTMLLSLWTMLTLHECQWLILESFWIRRWPCTRDNSHLTQISYQLFSVINSSPLPLLSVLSPSLLSSSFLPSLLFLPHTTIHKPDIIGDKQCWATYLHFIFQTISHLLVISISSPSPSFPPSYHQLPSLTYPTSPYSLSTPPLPHPSPLLSHSPPFTFPSSPQKSDMIGKFRYQIISLPFMHI